MEKRFFRVKSGFNKFKDSAMGQVITGMIPEDATQAFAVGAAPKEIIKVLPDGTRIKVIAEGISGASKRAKGQMSNIDRYMKGKTDTQLAADEIINAMRNKGLSVDEREIFTNVARGNGAIYSKYLK